MAWAIQADGSNDLMTFASVSIPANENFTIRIAASLDDLINRSFAGQSGAFNNVIRTASASQWKFRANAVESNLDFIEPLVDFAVFDVEIKRTGGATGTIDIVDTATQSSLLVATVNNPNELTLNGLFRYGNSSFRFLGEFQLLEITSATVNNKWDATASDHSNTGAQPVLVDTVGSNDATGSGFPTDGSAWVDLGGGGVTGEITQTLQSFNQSLSGSVVNSYTGTIAQVTQSFTQSLVGTVTSADINGTIEQALNSFTQSATGSTVTNITGSISQSLGSFTQSLSGTVVENITGVISQTLSAFTQSLSGTVVEQIAGSINQTVSSFTMSANGKIPASWADKSVTITNWGNQTKVTTTWTDK